MYLFTTRQVILSPKHSREFLGFFLKANTCSPFQTTCYGLLQNQSQRYEEPVLSLPVLSVCLVTKVGNLTQLFYI